MLIMDNVSWMEEISWRRDNRVGKNKVWKKNNTPRTRKSVVGNKQYSGRRRLPTIPACNLDISRQINYTPVHSMTAEWLFKVLQKMLTPIYSFSSNVSLSMKSGNPIFSRIASTWNWTTMIVVAVEWWCPHTNYQVGQLYRLQKK